MNACYLLLGTNLGNKIENLKRANEGLMQQVGNLLHASAIYSTSAWGKEDQNDFLNQVIHLQTELSPTDLLNACLSIEKDLGRVRFEKWSERLIDIDVLYYNDAVMDTPHLKIPHPFIQDRRFTLVPLVELAADYVHPVFNQTNAELLMLCKDPLGVDRIEVV